jgi:hypothetical protein
LGDPNGASGLGFSTHRAALARPLWLLFLEKFFESFLILTDEVVTEKML